MAVIDRELALKALDLEFQREVLDKLVRLETKMDALMGNGQPGRMKVVEDKVAVLERNDLRNSMHNRLLNGATSGNPANFYNEAIVPMALSNVPVININGQSWLTFQHFLVNWFDQYGVYVQGASDRLCSRIWKRTR